MSTMLPPFEPPGSVDVDDFSRLDMRLGRIITVVNLPPRRVAGYRSDVLVLSAMAGETVPLLGTETDAEPGQRIA